jgi:hypothetical protein
VELEAVFTQRRFNIAINDLLNSVDWQIGWQSTIKEQA